MANRRTIGASPVPAVTALQTDAAARRWDIVLLNKTREKRISTITFSQGVPRLGLSLFGVNLDRIALAAPCPVLPRQRPNCGHR
jgi:hypothetical protein